MYAYRTQAIAAFAAIAFTFGVVGCKSSTPTAPVANDATMSTALQSRISGDSALSSEPIQTSVRDGIATLSGTVSSEAARSLAASDAAQVAGIRTVINNLSVQQPPPAAAAVTTPPPAPIHAQTPKPPAPKIKPVPVSQPAPAPASAPAPIERPAPVARQEPAPPSPAPAPAPAPPAFRNVTIPSGTAIPVRITQTLDSATVQQGQSFSGTVASDVMADGIVAIRQGTPVSGRVSAVQEAAHYKGSSLLSIELTGINPRGQSLGVTSDPFTVEGKGRGKNTAAKVGGGAAVGAILGGIFGGGKGAAIGAAAGGGLGAGANTITRGEQVQIPSESLINFHLGNAVPLRVSTSNTQNAPGNTDGEPTGRRPMTPPQDAPQ